MNGGVAARFLLILVILPGLLGTAVTSGTKAATAPETSANSVPTGISPTSP